MRGTHASPRSHSHQYRTSSPPTAMALTVSPVSSPRRRFTPEPHRKSFAPSSFAPSSSSSSSSSSFAGAAKLPFLLLSLLVLALLLIHLNIFPSVPKTSLTSLPEKVTAKTEAATAAASCPSGYIYVHDLPPQFNADILAACDSLAPWYSLCPAFQNAGFGLPAAETNLSHILPEPLWHSWYATDQFSLEQIFHLRLLSHRCRTADPTAATAFYIPFYAGLAVGRKLWSADLTAAERDADCNALLTWLSRQPAFLKSNGADHFIALGRITWDFRRVEDSAWGSSFLNMPAMANVTRLLIERDTADAHDVGIPYPTGFHPRNEAAVAEWAEFVKSRRRKTLFSFAGGARSYIKGDFRAILSRECDSAGALCRTVDCSEGNCIRNNSRAPELFLDSKFCLQPRGDSFTRRSLFDCVVAGAIPVLFWRKSAYDKQYEWYLTGEESEWSVFIDRKDVRSGAVSIFSVLSGIGEDRVRRMRENVVEMIPRLVYADAGDGDGGIVDAFEVAVAGVLRRFRQRRQMR